MARSQITIDRLRLFGALKRSKREFARDARVIEKIIDKMRSDKDYHYLSISQDDFNKVSYAKSKQDKFNSDKRIKTTLGRYVRRKMKIKENELSDTTLSNLSDFVAIAIGQKKEETVGKDEVKMLTGKDIVDFYVKSDRHLHTCMTGRGRAKYVNFYALNPEKVSLVITSDRKARALLWTTDKGEKVLDRIYPASGAGNRKIKAWAAANKIQKPKKTHKVTMKHNGYFPYIDFFKYGRIDSVSKARSHKPGTVVLSPNGNYGNAYFTSGEGSFTEVFMCEKCEKKLGYYDRFHFRDEENCNVTVCERCYNKFVSKCVYCKNSYAKTCLKQLEDAPIDISIEGLCETCIVSLSKSKKICIKCNKKIPLIKCFSIDFHRRRSLDYCICYSCLGGQN